MKTLKFLLTGMIAFGLVSACESSEELNLNDSNIHTRNLGSSDAPGSGMIKVPFTNGPLRLS